MLRLRTTLSDRELADYVCRQIRGFFDDGCAVSRDDLLALLPMTMQRLEHCFTHIRNKYFFDGQQAVFDHLHGDQYAMFLYLLGNTAFAAGADRLVAAKAYLLNKALHGIDAFYEVQLPSIFMFQHPLATVLGRGQYSDYFLVYQRCGVGSNHDIYPVLGQHLTLRPGSSVLGDSKIGRNCTVAAESLVLDRDLADNTIYIGNPRDFIERAADAPLSVWREGV